MQLPDADRKFVAQMLDDIATETFQFVANEFQGQRHPQFDISPRLLVWEPGGIMSYGDLPHPALGHLSEHGQLVAGVLTERAPLAACYVGPATRTDTDGEIIAFFALDRLGEVRIAHTDLTRRRFRGPKLGDLKHLGYPAERSEFIDTLRFGITAITRKANAQYN